MLFTVTRFFLPAAFSLVALAAFAPVSAQRAELPEDAYRVTPTPDLGAPFLIHIPRDLKDAIAELKKMLTPALQEDMKARPERDMFAHHLGLGLFMRNNWALWSGSRLSKYFNELGISHPDDISAIIFRSFWRHLNDRPIDLEDEIAAHKAFSEKPAFGERIFEIQARGIGAANLLNHAAYFAKQNLVVGDEFENKRIDIHESSVSVDQLLTRTAADQGLVTRSYNDILLIGAECRLARPARIPNRGGYHKLVSMHFQNVAANALIGIFETFLMVPFNISEIDKAAPLTVGVFEKKTRDHIVAIATVQGWAARPFGKGGLKFIPDPRKANCGIRAKTASTITARMSTEATPLDKYELEEFRPLGYVQWLPTSSRLAIIETPNGTVLTLAIGSQLGKNRDRIRKITPSGIIVDELIESAGGRRTDRLRELLYQ